MHMSEARWPAGRPHHGPSAASVASVAFTDQREVRRAFNQALDQAATLVWASDPGRTGRRAGMTFECRNDKRLIS